MKTMNMPGFTAETGVYKTNRHYDSPGNPALSREGQRIIPQLRAGGGVRRAGFTCNGAGCRCDGLFDCIDMANTNVCGGTSFCYIGWVTGQLVCTCSR